jgi:small subunit ribosomal protein S17
MQSTMLRGNAFSGSQLRAATVRSSVAARSPMVVRAVQDLQGTVVSTSMNKSVVVAVERLAPHNKYFKRVRITKRYIAHDAAEDCKVGDYVRLEGCRPLSKHKRFTVAEVLRPAQ